MLVNQGDLTFIDEAAAAGLDIAAWNEMGAALGDYDNDGDFDLYMTNIEAPNDAVVIMWSIYALLVGEGPTRSASSTVISNSSNMRM